MVLSGMILSEVGSSIVRDSLSIVQTVGFLEHFTAIYKTRGNENKEPIIFTTSDKAVSIRCKQELGQIAS
ncbi:hypothetical protein L950_0218895 [Sphingobacterium sp. IITKGP-BTPF85]|nr:hypothetical protein L950_0218895 [Sphingobacterium sp. IITKGP-BTPF85]